MQQHDLAKLLNVHKGSISNWENNKRFPDKDMLIKISEFFNVTADYLLGKTLQRNNKSDNFEIDIKLAIEILIKKSKELEKYKTKNEDDAIKTLSVILNALIENGTLNENNLDKETMEFIRSAIIMYIRNKKRPLITSSLFFVKFSV